MGFFGVSSLAQENSHMRDTKMLVVELELNS